MIEWGVKWIWILNENCFTYYELDNYIMRNEMLYIYIYLFRRWKCVEWIDGRWYEVIFDYSNLNGVILYEDTLNLCLWMRFVVWKSYWDYEGMNVNIGIWMFELMIDWVLYNYEWIDTIKYLFEVFLNYLERHMRGGSYIAFIKLK